MELIQGHIWELGIGMVTVLGGINAFFVAKLIGKIDDNATIVQESSKQLAILSEKVQGLSDIHNRVITLEKSVAVLEYVIKTSSERRSSDDHK